MRDLFLCAVILCTVLFNILIYNQSSEAPVHHRQRDWSQKKSRLLRKENYTPNSCEQLLDGWGLDIPVLLIDLNFLKILDNENCEWYSEQSIKIGVNEKYKSEKFQIDKSRFEIVRYTDDFSKDFLIFEVDGRRIIPRNFETNWIGSYEIPADTLRFAEFWNRSKFLECLNLDMKRNWYNFANLNGPASANILARLRDELLDNGMFPFLNGGTLLGWYRECSIIPHTTDLDFSVARDNYSPEYPKKLLNEENMDFKLYRSLGELNDSLELTVVSKTELKPLIDIFIMYDGIEDGKLTYSYTSGLSADGIKYRFTFPIYDPRCAAELHNHIFWVSCSPEEQLAHEYGPEWRLDHPSESYTWNKSGRNIKVVGNFTKDEMLKYYRMYPVRDYYFW